MRADECILHGPHRESLIEIIDTTNDEKSGATLFMKKAGAFCVWDLDELKNFEVLKVLVNPFSGLTYGMFTYVVERREKFLARRGLTMETEKENLSPVEKLLKLAGKNRRCVP